MLLLQAAAALLLLLVCTFAPGFFVVRRLRWSAMEKLCGSIAVSLIFLWLSAWAIYLSGAGPAAYYAVSAICLGLGIAPWGDLRRLLDVFRVRRTLIAFAFLLGWTMVALSIIRVYHGAGWRGDWLEHFQRTLFFLHHFPKDTEIFGNYQLAARPPAENLFAALFLAQTGDRFELFQIVFSFLNLLVFFPCALVLRRLPLLPLAALFATSPIVMQNATYTWTKLLTAFLVITALAFYLKGWRRNDSTRLVFAFACLAMGMLVHYSAGPYVFFFALHYLIFVWPRRAAKWRELALIGFTCGFLLATWFGWSLATYGFRSTFESNTAVTSSQEYRGSNLGKIAANMVDSLVPHVLRDPALAHFFEQPNGAAELRDNVFIIYQSQLLFAMGIIGGPLVVWLAIASFRKRWKRPPERTFWILLIVSAVLIGIAVAGERDRFGSAHLTLLPVEILGLTLLASRFSRSRTVALLIVAGCAIDFFLGVYLHLRVQHLENSAEDTPFSRPVAINGQIAMPSSADSLSDIAWQSWSRKHQLQNNLQWKKEFQGAEVAGKAEAIAVMDKAIAEDARLWGGWYARHGGEVEYVGDHFGASGGSAASILLIGLWAMLLLRMWHQVPRSVVAQGGASRPAPLKSARPKAKR